MPADEKRDPKTYSIIGAAIEVHKQLGRGFLKAVYREALELELTARGISFRREVELPLSYKGKELRRLSAQISSASIRLSWN